MDSSSPSTSACYSSDRSDARNGEGLAVDEIMRMKERRLRLLDDYRNEQEESILPLMREVDDINRKRKKKSKSQFHAENNTPLRRSERIMIQTLNGNRTPESPMHQPQLEPDPIFEPQLEPEFEPAPAQREESEPEFEPTDESEPEPEPMNESDSELESTDEYEPESEPTDESDSELESTDESEPELDPINESDSELESTDESDSELDPMNESEPELDPMNESGPELDPMNESEPELDPMNESGPEFGPMDEYDSELESTDESEPEFGPMDEFELQLIRRFELEQLAPPMSPRVVRRAGSPSRRFEVERPGRHLFDVQLASRRVFAVHPAPRYGVGPVPAPRWRNPAFNIGDNWYGAKEGFNIGHQWNTRLECSRDKVHRPSIAGIHPGPYGAYSVALSGAYPEDVDRGKVVIFTGSGGRDLRGADGRSRSVRNAPQVRDQELNKFNVSLIRSAKSGNPVRLIRGHKLASSFAPERGYRYDGLYRVVRFWYGRGYSGFRVFRFKMSRLKNQSPPPWETARRAPIPRRVPALPPRDPTPPPRDPTPPPRDPTPPPRDPTPPPRDPTPPPRDPTPPPSTSAATPSTSAATPSTSAGPPRKRARVQSNSSSGTASCGELDEEIEECIKKLCPDSPYESDDDEEHLTVFPGWNMP